MAPALQRLTYRDLVKVCVRIISSMEGLHKKGLTHRDIKPPNLALSYDANTAQKDASWQSGMKLYFHLHHNQTAYLLDLHRGVRFKRDNGTLLPPEMMQRRPQRPSIYTPPSLVSGIGYTRKDDMIAIGYVLIRLTGVYLPWECATNRDSIVKQMQATSASELTKDAPVAFKKYFAHVYSLGFYDAPDYDLLRRGFLEGLDEADKAYSPSWMPSVCSLLNMNQRLLMPKQKSRK